MLFAVLLLCLVYVADCCALLGSLGCDCLLLVISFVWVFVLFGVCLCFYCCFIAWGFGLRWCFLLRLICWLLGLLVVF